MAKRMVKGNVQECISETLIVVIVGTDRLSKKVHNFTILKNWYC